MTEQTREILNSLSSLYPLQDYEEQAIDEVLDAAKQPERIKGHWVDDCTYMGIQCSVCGKSLQDYIHATEYAELMEVPNFCPNCGADMRGEQDG